MVISQSNIFTRWKAVDKNFDQRYTASYNSEKIGHFAANQRSDESRKIDNLVSQKSPESSKVSIAASMQEISP